MKAKSKVVVVALMLVSVAAILGSCQKKTCPAYSKVSTEQAVKNA